MSNVIKLITNTERRAQEVAQEFPGLKSLYDRFCETCQDSLRIGQPICGEDHEIRELNPIEQEAEIVYKMWEYS